MNLVELVKNQLGGDVVNQLGGMVGAPPDQTRSAVNVAVPALLASLGHLASTPGGSQKLSQVIDQADDKFSGNASQAFSAGGASLAGSGTATLTSLFGNSAVSNMGSVLSKFTNIGSGSTTSLLGALTPMVLSVLKAKKKEMGLDASGVSTLMADQKQSIASALPSGLGSVLSSVPGLAVMSGTAGATVGKMAGIGSVSRWGWPVLGIILIAAGLIWWVMSSGQKPAHPTTPPAVNAPGGAVRAGEAIEAAAKTVSVSGIKDQISGFFSSTTDTLKGITDSASAEAALPKLRDATAKLDSLTTAVNGLSAGERTQVNPLLSTSLETLKPAIDKVMAVPGVSDKIKPTVDALWAKASALTTK